MSIIEAVKEFFTKGEEMKKKPCSCPEEIRYWTNSAVPRDSDLIDKGYVINKTETDASTVKVWRPTYVFRCRNCGSFFYNIFSIGARSITEYDDGSVAKMVLSGWGPEEPKFDEWYPEDPQDGLSYPGKPNNYKSELYDI